MCNTTKFVFYLINIESNANEKMQPFKKLLLKVLSEAWIGTQVFEIAFLIILHLILVLFKKYSHYIQLLLIDKTLPMLGYEPRIYCANSCCSTIRAATAITRLSGI